LSQTVTTSFHVVFATIFLVNQETSDGTL